MIFTAILALNSDECIDAFKAAGLTDPFTAVTGANGFNGGVVIGPASLATNPQNAPYMGIPERARQEVLKELAVVWREPSLSWVGTTAMGNRAYS